MNNETTDIKNQIQLVIDMMSDDFDWDTHPTANLEDDFAECISKEDIPTERYSCGNYRPETTADGLYRLLWLVQPKSVDFSDMYKTRLFTFASADKRFVVTVELYKYELGLYYYAPRELIDSSNMSGIWSGMPDSDNGVKLKNPDDGLFFKMIEKAVETEHLVYGGNDFSV